MTTSRDPNPADPAAEPVDKAVPPVSGPSAHGLSELVVPGILVAVAIFLIVGTMNMAVPPSVQVPGPTFFPILIICLLLLMAVLSTIQILRSQAEHRRLSTTLSGDEHQDGQSSGFDDVDASGDCIRLGPDSARDLDGDEVAELPPDVPPGRQPWPTNAFSDWRALGTVLASLVLFIALLRPAGWIIAAALLFWGVSYALGARRPIFDASVALVMSSLIQLIFGAGLGLNLPAGFLEGIF